jgi:intein/homing endonuclease
MQFKYNDDMLEEFLSKYFNGDKWDEIYNKSYVLSFETYQNIFVNQIPTQINNFANIQSFDNQSKEIQTTSQSFVIDIRDKIKEFKNNGLIYLIPFISFFLIYLNFYRLLNNYCLNSIIEEMGDFNMIYSLFLYYINKKEQKVPYIYENMIISIIVFLAINTGLISYLLIPKFIQNYTYYIVVLGTYYYSIFLSIFMLF